MHSHRLRLGLIALLVGVVAVSACSPTRSGATSTPQPIPPGSTKRTQSIATGTIMVAPGASRDIGFYLDFWAYQPRVTGSFHASGGANDIEVFIINDEDFQNWQTGHAVKTIYDSRPATAGNVNVLLPTTGYFHLVLNNTYSNTEKFVQVDFYTEWWVAPSTPSTTS